MENPKLIRWEKVKSEMMGRPIVYYRGMSGAVELCTVNKWPGRKNDFYLSMSIREILGNDDLHTKTPGRLMHLVEERYAAWLKEAGIVVFTKEQARCILNSLSTAVMEGSSEQEKTTRGVEATIEEAFPDFKVQREEGEFRGWLWAIKVEADPRVKKARAKTERNDPSGDPEPRWDAIDEMMAVKGEVLKELMAKDQEPLKAEWKKDKDWRQRVDRVS